MKDESLSLSLSDTVATADHLELPAEIAEFALDQAIDSEVLKDVPFIGWIAKGISMVRSISDRILLNKILRFLTQLKSLDSLEKAEFTAMVKIDSDYRRKVGERLILALDRLDEPEKLEILAKCFDHFLTGHLDYDEFSELAHVIDRSFLTDLRFLGVDSSYNPIQHGDRMAASGLASVQTHRFALDPNAEVSIGYSISPVGSRLQMILLGEFREWVRERGKTTPYQMVWPG